MFTAITVAALVQEYGLETSDGIPVSLYSCVVSESSFSMYGPNPFGSIAWCRMEACDAHLEVLHGAEWKRAMRMWGGGGTETEAERWVGSEC